MGGWVASEARSVVVTARVVFTARSLPAALRTAACARAVITWLRQALLCLLSTQALLSQ